MTMQLFYINMLLASCNDGDGLCLNMLGML